MLLGRPRTATPKLCETSIGEEGGVVYGGGVLDERTNRSKHSYVMSPGGECSHVILFNVFFSANAVPLLCIVYSFWCGAMMTMRIFSVKYS